MEFIAADKYVEATPQSIRVQEKILQANKMPPRPRREE